MTSVISETPVSLSSVPITWNNSVQFSGGERHSELNGDLVAACLGGADLRGIRLNGRDLTFADAAGADLRVADLSDATLASATLTYADLRDSYCPRVNLNGADLYGADLRRANLSGAWLGNANMDEVEFEGANLSGAAYDKYTCWPEGFDPEAAGAMLVDARKDLSQVAYPATDALQFGFSYTR